MQDAGVTKSLQMVLHAVIQLQQVITYSRAFQEYKENKASFSRSFPGPDFQKFLNCQDF